MTVLSWADRLGYMPGVPSLLFAGVVHGFLALAATVGQVPIPVSGPIVGASVVITAICAEVFRRWVLQVGQRRAQIAEHRLQALLDAVTTEPGVALSGSGTEDEPYRLSVARVPELTAVP